MILVWTPLTVYCIYRGTVRNSLLDRNSYSNLVAIELISEWQYTDGFWNCCVFFYNGIVARRLWHELLSKYTVGKAYLESYAYVQGVFFGCIRSIKAAAGVNMVSEKNSITSTTDNVLTSTFTTASGKTIELLETASERISRLSGRDVEVEENKEEKDGEDGEDSEDGEDDEEEGEECERITEDFQSNTDVIKSIRFVHKSMRLKKSPSGLSASKSVKHIKSKSIKEESGCSGTIIAIAGSDPGVPFDETFAI